MAALRDYVVEDTPVTLEEIDLRLGPYVAELVEWLTNVSGPQDGNRTIRKHFGLLHTARLGIPPGEHIGFLGSEEEAADAEHLFHYISLRPGPRINSHPPTAAESHAPPLVRFGVGS